MLPHPQPIPLSESVNLENLPPLYISQIMVKPLTPEEERGMEREMFLPSIEEALGFDDNSDNYYKAFRVSPICEIFLTVF